MGQAFPQSLSGGRRDRGAAAIRAGRFRSQRVGGALPQAGPGMSQVRSRDGTTIGWARDFTVFVYDRRGRGASGDTAPYARRLAEAIPGAQLRGLPGQTHNVAATALAPVLKEFFAP